MMHDNWLLSWPNNNNKVLLNFEREQLLFQTFPRILKFLLNKVLNICKHSLMHFLLGAVSTAMSPTMAQGQSLRFVTPEVRRSSPLLGRRLLFFGFCPPPPPRATTFHTAIVDAYFTGMFNSTHTAATTAQPTDAPTTEAAAATAPTSEALSIAPPTDVPASMLFPNPHRHQVAPPKCHFESIF